MKRNYKEELIRVANEELQASQDLNRTWQKRYEDLALEHAKLQNTEKALKKRMQLKNEEIDQYVKEVKELTKTNEDLARDNRPNSIPELKNTSPVSQVGFYVNIEEYYCKFCEDTGLDLWGDPCSHCGIKY